MGVNGFSLKRLIVKEDPRLVTCLPKVAFNLEPSGIVASNSGSATEICLPHFWANQTTKESSSTSFSKRMLLRIEPYFLWNMKRGMLTPSQEQSSTFRSVIMTSMTP